MDDYISRQVAIDALDGLCDIVCQYSKKQRSVMCGACPLGSAFDTIDELPSADAVEVVRCRDCKHRYIDGENVRYNVCDLNHNKVQEDDWYCADGERKDG